MRKIMIVMLVLMLALSLVACGTSNTQEPAASPTKAAEEVSKTEAPAATDAAVSEATAETTDDSWTAIQQKGAFTLGFDETFAPMGFKDDSGNYVGFDIDLAKEVSSRLGLSEPKFQPIDWDSKELELDAGNIDVIWNGLTITDERKAKMLFSDPYMDNRQIVVVAADSGIKTIADLADKSVAAQVDSSAMAAIDAQPDIKDSFGELVESADYVTALMELKQGSVDAVVVDETMGSYYINEDDNPDAYSILDENFGEEQYGIGFRKSDVAFETKIQEALNEIVKDGTFAKIAEKWFGHDVWPK